MKLVLVLLVIVLILNLVNVLNVLNIYKLYTNNTEFFASPLSSLVGTKWKCQKIQKINEKGVSIIITVNALLHFTSKDNVNFEISAKGALANNPKKIVYENKQSKTGIYTFSPKTKTGDILDGKDDKNKSTFRMNTKGELEIMSEPNKVDMTFKRV